MKLNKIKNKFKKAFTLVELIIVIAVIAILAVFIVPNFSNVLGDANVTNVKSDTANVKNIVMAYINETGAVPVVNTKNGNSTINTTQLNRITIDKGTKKIQPGISLINFQNTAVDGTLYVLDMDLLTKDQINVDDRVSTVKAKLPSIPSTSAIINVRTAENGGTTGNVDMNKTVKSTSVVYCIDRDLNVYATYNKSIKKSTTTVPANSVAAPWVVLSPSSTFVEKANLTVSENHEIFKQSYISGVSVVAGLDVDDSNYN